MLVWVTVQTSEICLYQYGTNENVWSGSAPSTAVGVGALPEAPWLQSSKRPASVGVFGRNSGFGGTFGFSDTVLRTTTPRRACGPSL